MSSVTLLTDGSRVARRRYHTATILLSLRKGYVSICPKGTVVRKSGHSDSAASRDCFLHWIRLGLGHQIFKALATTKECIALWNSRWTTIKTNAPTQVGGRLEFLFPMTVTKVGFFRALRTLVLCIFEVR
jgi:hypothetical protein